ncbi:MAG: deoxyribonuclease IV [bacterium]
MRVGLHVSIAGGLERACLRAAEVGCETIQLFTRSPRGWSARPLDESGAGRFRRLTRALDITPVFVHAPYLVNLATTDRSLAARSRAVLVDELERAASLGASGVVVHPGRVRGREGGVARVARRVASVLRRAKGAVSLLLENTAGAAGEIGARFEELAEIIDRAGSADRLGMALDTAHAFAAGCELRNRPGLDAVLRELDRTVGLGRLQLLHLNDSRFGLDSHRDRHWHIGRGKIGLAGFRQVVNHPLLRHLPGILETPRADRRDDRRNLAAIRGLVR